MRIGIRQGRVQTRYSRRGHVQVCACVWVRHPSSLRTVPVLSTTSSVLDFPAAPFAVGGIAGGVEGRRTCIRP
ncbi:hypothetical protein L208DRAFT_1385397, partial [Tricholoma matsutake]